MIFNMVGGGAAGAGGGATLVVSSPANVSVTVSKDDKSYTKNSGSLGSTTFKGLATGTWTVTISGNGQTATKTIGITADYAITIAFFSAFINITYPANSNCVVTNSSGQTVASDTNTSSSTKTWTAVVGTTGTYTVTATATDGSGRSKSQSVSITFDGQDESVTLSYELVLFYNGNDNASVTGGWSYTYFYDTEKSFTINNNGINLYIYNNDGSGGIEARTNKTISLSNYKTLNVKVSNISKGTCVLGVSSAPDISGSNNCIASRSGSTTGTYTIDISSISDSLYIKLKIISNHSEGASMTISEVWLS